MFITEVFAKEYLEKFFQTKKEEFRAKNGIILYGLNEQALNLKELCDKNQISVTCFVDDTGRNAGKVIFSVPVIRKEEIDVEGYYVVTSATTAYRDKKVLCKAGCKEENIVTFYPDTIEYFREGFEKIDREHYAGISIKDNNETRDRESQKEIEVSSIPSYLHLDLTTKCNLNCCHCDAHHNKDISRYRNQAENYTSMSRYQFLLDYAQEIYLNISGEPLLAPDFWKILDYINKSDNDPYVFTVTNGLLLDEEAATKIVKSKFKQLYVSMDASTEKTYARLRRGGDYKTWYKNVKRLCELKEEYNSNFKVSLQYSVSREGLEDIPGAVRAAADLGVTNLILRPIYTDIPGREDWCIDMDETAKYYYPQQDLIYYPHQTKDILDEARKIGEELNVKLDISSRFSLIFDDNIEDCVYPQDIESFNKKRFKIDEYLKNRTFDENHVEEIVKEETRVCMDPWNVMMVFTSGNIMYCNRMEMMEGNLNFSSIYDLRNSKMAHRIRKGLIDEDLSIDCMTCCGCEVSEAFKKKPHDIKYFEKGEGIDFHLERANNLRKVKYEGISRIQREGAWNNLTVSTIDMHVAKDSEDMTFMLEGEAFIIPGLVDEQVVEISANGKEVKKLVINSLDRANYEFVVPTDSVADDGKLELKFSFPKAESMLRLGLGRDERKRAFYFTKLMRK